MDFAQRKQKDKYKWRQFDNMFGCTLPLFGSEDANIFGIICWLGVSEAGQDNCILTPYSNAKDPTSPPCMSEHICCFLPVWRLYGSKNMARKQRLRGDSQQLGDEATRGFWWNLEILVAESQIKEICLPKYKYTSKSRQTGQDNF